MAAAGSCWRPTNPGGSSAVIVDQLRPPPDFLRTFCGLIKINFETQTKILSLSGAAGEPVSCVTGR
jgi:hypothetical protein